VNIHGQTEMVELNKQGSVKEVEEIFTLQFNLKAFFREVDDVDAADFVKEGVRPVQGGGIGWDGTWTPVFSRICQGRLARAEAYQFTQEWRGWVLVSQCFRGGETWKLTLLTGCSIGHDGFDDLSEALAVCEWST
jgi:hypothetical protein